MTTPPTSTEFYFPQEPIRLSVDSLNEILIHSVKLGASDITLQTNEAIIAEIFGRLKKVTRRRLSNTEVGEIINAMYGPKSVQTVVNVTVSVLTPPAAKWKAMMAYKSRREPFPATRPP
jgi:Tfp pilus assembly pilus retraction ATPase PilT